MRARSAQPEWMDTVAIPEEDFARCLGDLATVNLVTRATVPTLAFLRQASRRCPRDRPLRILDVGSGGGDMLRRIGRWGKRRGQALELTGLDLHPHSTATAVRAGSDLIRYVNGDIFDWSYGASFDLIISSLFTHHLSDASLVRFLRVMEERSELGWFVNDLHRHPVAYEGFRLMSLAAGWHGFVRHDGAVSVRRAFRVGEWRGYLAAAGIEGAEIRWYFPFRLCVSRLR